MRNRKTDQLFVLSATEDERYKFLSCAVALMLMLLAVQVGRGAPITVLEPGTTLSVFDTGGFLDPDTNGGFTLGGLEVTGVGSVFVLASDGGTGNTSTSVQLIGSSGPGTAAAVGPVVPLGLTARGFDLTRHPTSGLLNVAGTLSPIADPVDGIHGLDPAGVAAPVTFATTTNGFATSGLTFDSTGASALVSTDGVNADVLPNGLYSVPEGGPEVAVALDGSLPNGIPAGTDDHVITVDGRTIIAGDGSHEFWDATGGAGAVSLLIALDTIPDLAQHLGVGGNRAAVDPVSGDIFYAFGLGGPSIIRVKADGSAASAVATGFPSVRDLDFGPASDGSDDINLYVTEVDGGVGTIYEFNLVPEPSALTLAVLGAVLCRLAKEKRRGRFPRNPTP